MVVSAELQAVLMAGGRGSRMTELTARKPKCLLPVGNFPMIWYPLNLLQKSGFQEVTVVVLEMNKNEIQLSLEKLSMKIKFDIVSIPQGEDWGTADSLRFLEESNKIKTDVLVLSCDLITDVSLSPLLELYRRHDASVTALFAPVNTAPISVPGPPAKHKIERDFVMLEEESSRLVFIASASDYEAELPLPRRLLRRLGRASLSSSLLDAHVYILKRVLCKYLLHNKNIGTIKGELLPLVVKKQMQTLPKKLEQDKATSIVGVDTKTDLVELSEESELTLKARSMSSFSERRLEPAYRGETLRCYATLLPTALLIRANSLAEYTRANLTVLEKWAELSGTEERVASTATVSSSQLEAGSCLVGERASVAEKTSIKSSLIGSGASVLSKTRVSGSILMGSATIGVGCNIQNCIVCEGSVVSDGCELKDCIVGSHFTVPSGGKHNREILTEEDRLMEMTL